jgi:hypothetical protein
MSQLLKHIKTLFRPHSPPPGPLHSEISYARDIAEAEARDQRIEALRASTRAKKEAKKAKKYVFPSITPHSPKPNQKIQTQSCQSRHSNSTSTTTKTSNETSASLPTHAPLGSPRSIFEGYRESTGE